MNEIKYNVGDTIIEVPINGIIKYYDVQTNTYFDYDPRIYLPPVDAIANTNNYLWIGLIIVALFFVVK